MAEDDALRRRIQRENRRRDIRAERFVESLARVLERELPRLAREVNNADLEDQFAIIGTLFQTLRERGLNTALDQLQDDFADEFETVVEEYERIGFDNVFTAVDANIWETAIAVAVDDIDLHIEARVSGIKSAVLEQVLIGVPVDIDNLIDVESPRLASQIKTEINTTMQSFNRAVTVQKAIDIFGENPRFLYIGPFDAATRDFCEDVLTKRDPPIYSLREIQNMDNEQGLPVLTSGGGYNCRHDWRPVSKELEQALRGDS